LPLVLKRVPLQEDLQGSKCVIPQGEAPEAVVVLDQPNV
jgi:hypothetical protein